MAAHSTDVFLLRVALIGCLMVALLIPAPLFFRASRKSVKRTPTHPDGMAGNDIKVSCWAPSQFTSAHVNFANAVCTANLEKAIHNKNATGTSIYSTEYTDGFTPPEFNEELMQILGNCDSSTKAHKEETARDDKDESEDQQARFKSPLETLVKYLIIQVFVVCIVYLLAKCLGDVILSHSVFVSVAWRLVLGGDVTGMPDSADNSDGLGGELLLKSQGVVASRLNELAKTRMLAVLYLGLHIAVAVLWLMIAIGSCHSIPHPSNSPANNMPSKAHSSSGTFLCDFRIRALANVVRYTVQCSYDVTIVSNDQSNDITLGSPESAEMVGQTHMAVARVGMMLNFALCVLLTVLGLCHIAHTFVLAPISHRRSMQLIMQQLDVTHSPLEGCAFGVSDLYIVAAFTLLNVPKNNLIYGASSLKSNDTPIYRKSSDLAMEKAV